MKTHLVSLIGLVCFFALALNIQAAPMAKQTAARAT